MNDVTRLGKRNWETERSMTVVVMLVFCAALVAHAWFTTRNWRAGFMPGHEFRQAHTALITHYIDEENNFTPLYTVPLFGKPWVCPLEFPLYEWSVVGVSRLTGWKHLWAARTVTLACFYLMLPGLYLLLGHLSLSPRRRLLPLAVVLACPVYIFYSRSFLMEAMVLMFAIWFLLGFVRTMQRRQIRWAVLAAICGAGAALIKSTTFFVWLAPAAAYGAWCLFQSFRQEPRARAVLATLAWGLGTAAIPCGTAYWWITYTDAIKAAHPSAFIFASRQLTSGNFGMYDLSARFSAETWKTLFERWGEALAPASLVWAWLVVGALLPGRGRMVVLMAAPFFFLAQLMFPYAYALQEYYFYACALFVLVPAGAALNSILDLRAPAFVRILLIVALPVALVANYRRVYEEIQRIPSTGGLGITEAIKTVTPRDSVIVVIGDDWSPIMPYYAQRKALMVRSGLENDAAYLARAFDDLEGEKVSALIMARGQRENFELARKVAARFGLDASPTFSHPVGDVYLASEYRDAAVVLLAPDEIGKGPYDGVVVKATLSRKFEGDALSLAIPPELASAAFSMVKPAPVNYRFAYGYRRWPFEGGEVLSVHPDADLEIMPPRGASEIYWEFGILSSAYEREGDRTNGVEFIVMGESASGERRQIYRRVLEPVGVVTDRGTQRVVVPYSAAKEEKLVFMTRPNGNHACDWAYTRRIEVR